MDRRFNNSAPRKLDMAEIIAGCDRLFNADDPTALGEYLVKYRDIARAYGDKSSELSLLNELIGHYRMQGNREQGLAAVEDALKLIELLNIENSVSCGTILLNAATALSSFGQQPEALDLYRRAEACYRKSLNPNDRLFAGLYNNNAAALLANGELKSARELYLKALDILQKHNELMDAAVTFVNLAQLAYQLDEASEIDIMLKNAMELFEHPAAERNGYYAHTCKKCAAVFGFFGYPELEEELMLRAEAIYANN